jgi:hypothetical protein
MQSLLDGASLSGLLDNRLGKEMGRGGGRKRQNTNSVSYVRNQSLCVCGMEQRNIGRAPLETTRAKSGHIQSGPRERERRGSSSTLH